MATPWNREAQPLVRLNAVMYINIVMSSATSSTSNADLWVASKGVTHLESAVPFSEAPRHLAPGVQGVANAQAHIVSFGTWTRPGAAPGRA